MPLYDISNITAATDLASTGKAVNDITVGSLGIGALLTVAILTFIYESKRSGMVAGLGAASFICMISATILIAIEWVSFGTYTIVLLISTVIMIVTWFTSGN